MKHAMIAPALAGLLSLSACGPAVVGAAGVATLGVGVGQERSTEDALSDIETQVAINNALLNHSGALFRDVQIGVAEGRVLLTGSTDTADDAVKAVEIAHAQKGTREVINELTVGEGSTAQSAEDIWISTQVRARIIGATDVGSVDYNIETYNGVVHLIGVARSEAEIRAAAEAAAATPGVKRVVSHMMTIDDPRRNAAG